MTSAFEAAGDAISGAVFGRAVEPSHGEAAGDGHGHCANCGTTLIGGYCHACGQNAHVHRTIGGIGHEIAHGVFHFEGKIWRTIPLLAWKPGELTRRYIHGERARFVSPMALFLFAVFLTFAVFESVGGPIRVGNGSDLMHYDMAVDIAKARTDLANALATPVPADAKAAHKRDAHIKALKADIDGMQKGQNYLNGEASASDAAKDFNVNTGSAEADKRITEALKNPKLTLYKLQSSAYKYAWAMIVLSLPFMWLMFPFRRDVHLYDHAVFVTYSLSSVMLLLILMALVAPLGVQTGWLLALFPLHLFIQLRGAYQLRKRSALWRTMALLIAAFIVLTGFITLLLVLGLMA
ncbi:DUF3667 domain-containing protein [Sphingomonas antarctica]|uniref:DUF3667 domain-containing protein n=1 Tax=Sphingomonas antarctica TaxID=2040274 RepID=UPI0039EABA7E